MIYPVGPMGRPWRVPWGWRDHCVKCHDDQSLMQIGGSAWRCRRGHELWTSILHDGLWVPARSAEYVITEATS